MAMEVERLRDIPWLAGASPAAHQALARGGALVRFAAGEVLWTAGARPRGLFVVLSGSVRVVRAAGGRQRAVHTEGPGGTLGEVPLFAGGRYPATAVAAAETVCAGFPVDALERAVAADPAVAMALLGRLAGRVRQLVERLDAVGRLGVEARLAAHLLEHADAHGGVRLERSQAALAEELGTVREVLVRALGRLRRAGLVASAGRGRLQLLDAAALRRIAQGGPRAAG